MENNLFGVCPFVTAQKLLQGKWAILILHALSEGTKRFNDLEREIHITHATLSSQLKYMEKEGLVHRTVYPEVPPRVEYTLTELGYSLPHRHGPPFCAGASQHTDLGRGIYRVSERESYVNTYMPNLQTGIGRITASLAVIFFAKF